MNEALQALGILALSVLLMAGVIVVWLQRLRRMQNRLNAIKTQENALLVTGLYSVRSEISQINGGRPRRERCNVSVGARRLAVFDQSLEMVEQFACDYDQVRWFGRPEKYTPGLNSIWLHIERPDGWFVLKLTMQRSAMAEFVAALKAVVAPELVTAYRRRRPYVHAGPVTARPADQDIHGAWSLADAVTLYLTPRFLVILSGRQVLRTLPLEAVQQIGALRRIDQPQADGLVRFRAEEEPFAFALPAYESFAASLAEAAKRTLEAPLERKQKGKDEDEDWELEN